MLFSSRNTRNNTLQGEGAVVILQAIRRAGKNNTLLRFCTDGCIFRS